jgi:penicillin amidase
LTAWLAGTDQIDVSASVVMQMNADNVHGRRILDALAALPIPQAHGSEWLELQAWGGKETADSRAALLFQVWYRRHFRRWLVDTCLDRLGVGRERAVARQRLVREDTLFSDLRPDMRMIEMLDLEDERESGQVAISIDESLGKALAELEHFLGPNRGEWTWGALHRTELRHPVFYQLSGVPEGWGTLPPVA